MPPTATSPDPGPAAATPAPPHDPFDPAYGREFVSRVMKPIERDWFRARIVGAERIPAHGPVILAANHSGNAFPYDGMLLDAMLWERDGTTVASKFRTVYEAELSYEWWMRPCGLENFWRRCGGVDMTFDNFDRLLARGDRVLYFPEGVPGIGKGFNRRYQLQAFKTSFVAMAAKHHIPVYPTYVLNGEWIHPFGYTFPPLDWLFQRLFHVPFLPLPLGAVAVGWPWVWYLAFPAHLVFAIGEPLDVRAMLREEGVADDATPDRPTLKRVAERIRGKMQAELDLLVREHATVRYGPRHLWGHLRRALAAKRLAGALPICWPATFIRFDRDRRRPPARNRLHAVLRDWDLVGFWLPLGWPLLSLARAFRRPPYGYRGVPRAERRERQGRFLWRLSERPLPPREEAAAARPAPAPAPALGFRAERGVEAAR